jgi:hypothetical protein
VKFKFLHFCRKYNFFDIFLKGSIYELIKEIFLIKIFQDCLYLENINSKYLFFYGVYQGLCMHQPKTFKHINRGRNIKYKILI